MQDQSNQNSGTTPVSAVPLQPVQSTESTPVSSPNLPPAPPSMNQADEGTVNNYVFASFLRRFAASIIDLVVIMIVLMPLAFVTGDYQSFSGTEAGSGSMLYNFLSYAVSWGYFMFFIGSRGQTLGKMAVKIKVVRKEDGQAPGYLKAFLREIVGKFISSLILALGYFWVIWDKEKQAWHDKIAGTYVIKL